MRGREIIFHSRHSSAEGLCATRGGFTTKENADKFAQEGWMVKEDAGRGWRRMIASPIPLKIIELDARPSDCLAIAARAGAAIYVTRNVWDSLEDRQPLLDQMRAGKPDEPGLDFGD
jgi:hypothetical protein